MANPPGIRPPHQCSNRKPRLTPARAEHCLTKRGGIVRRRSVETTSPRLAQAELPSIEQELEEWKRVPQTKVLKYPGASCR